MNQTLFTTEAAAHYLGVSKAFLERDRWAGARIPFIKLGTRSIRYRLEDLDRFIESQTRTSTSDTGDACRAHRTSAGVAQ